MFVLNFPSFNEYQAALQNPAVCFEHYELKNCLVENDLWGLPRVRSGGFALTYRLQHTSRSFAVRCFHRMVPDRASRYVAISNFISTNPSKIFIPVRFLPKGIRVRGNWFPVTFMKWVEGETLEAHLFKAIESGEQIGELQKSFLEVVNELERLGIAHGDLSHRNIMVKENRLVLIDYDGMYVPILNGRKSCEVGNPNFQHPGRTEKDFHEKIDRFSEMIIYIALETLCRRPDIWSKFETGGEGLLFKKEDFISPYSSKLINELLRIEELGAFVEKFQRICQIPFDRIPSLRDLLENKPIDLPEPAIKIEPVISKQVNPELLFASNERYEMLNRSGRMAVVIGQVMEIHRGKTKSGAPHYFLNFGNWRLNCFTIVIWDEALRLLAETGKDIETEFIGKFVSVSGILTVYKRRPQIVINSPMDIEILEENQANQRLEPAGKGKGQITPLRPQPLPTLVKRGTTSHLNFQPAQKINRSSNQNPSFSHLLGNGNLDQSQEIIEKIQKLFPEPNSNILDS